MALVHCFVSFTIEPVYLKLLKTSDASLFGLLPWEP